MQTVLIVIHLLVVIALVGAVLLQRSEGGVLGTGGGGGFMTGRGQANALSRATAILGTLYFVTALTMSILASWGRAPHSLINNVPTSTSTTARPLARRRSPRRACSISSSRCRTRAAARRLRRPLPPRRPRTRRSRMAAARRPDAC